MIRRREEKNATHSLLNSTKAMVGNPIILRREELEAIAGKAAHLTVHNGTKGMMDDIVQKRD
ncbi:hypothetical protein [Shimia abyssi]|uniref:Uncharacterized protein n=1 Tax=Shimia abyssi TaxID=1662395 RepID=A0A2P8FDF9_9RHOB|nr:hypothetical protein [Shimia abyssi]PSL19760.1 hypothetical protein CLV88_105183 [Shimia abyssi]